MPDVTPTTEAAHAPHANPRHQVVVIGSGFGGLFGTKALRKADVDVTMIATRLSSKSGVTRELPEPLP
ncbi:MAG: dehydrogenase, partial [Marmoricola sp.]|nr:dehydrogenase [Marmoricola sp.]